MVGSEENWVRPKLLHKSNNHLPTKQICYRHTVIIWINYILPSGFINKTISCISSRINSWHLLPERNGQLMIRCDILYKIIAHKLMTAIRIYEEQFVDIHSARKNNNKNKTLLCLVIVLFLLSVLHQQQ